MPGIVNLCLSFWKTGDHPACPPNSTEDSPFIVSRLVGHASAAFILAPYGHCTQDHLDTARVATTGIYGDVRPQLHSGTIVEHRAMQTIAAQNLRCPQCTRVNQTSRRPARRGLQRVERRAGDTRSDVEPGMQNVVLGVAWVDLARMKQHAEHGNEARHCNCTGHERESRRSADGEQHGLVVHAEHAHLDRPLPPFREQTQIRGSMVIIHSGEIDNRLE